MKKIYVAIFLLPFVFSFQAISTAEILFEDGFENEAGDNGGGSADFTSGLWGFKFNSDNCHITENPAYVRTGSKAFRSHYKATYDGGNGQLRKVLSQWNLNEIYFRYYMLVPSSWSWAGNRNGIKMVRMTSNGDDVMTHHPWGDFDNFSWFTNSWHHGTEDTGIENDRDVWYYLEAHIKLKDPGQSNTVLELWVAKDGQTPQKILDVTCSDTNDNTTEFSDLWFPNNTCGTTPTYENDLYFDDFAIGTSYIGPTLPRPKPPTALRIVE